MEYDTKKKYFAIEDLKSKVTKDELIRDSITH